MAKTNEKLVAVGTEIHLVTAFGGHRPARVTAVGEANRVDLVFQDAGKTVAITSAPLDETGTRPDSWHLPEVQAAAK